MTSQLARVVRDHGIASDDRCGCSHEVLQKWSVCEIGKGAGWVQHAKVVKVEVSTIMARDLFLFLLKE